MKIKFKKLDKDATIPTRGSEFAAGYDLTCTTYSIDDHWYTFKTSLAVEIPTGYCGLIYPRSSIYKTGFYLSNSVGVIDSDYRGEILIVFKTYLIWPTGYKIGDRVAQLVITKVEDIEFEEVQVLSETKRGVGGYGSTGN